ncbi:MAG: succinate--CoA ligase subunit alpha [Lautropia sp.]
MSILIDRDTRVLVQGATGSQARFDIRYCLEYGTRIVAGVTPGRGGESVEGIPVFNTVDAAIRATGANATAIYVPARGVVDAVLEAIDGGLRMLLALAENVPRHDAARAVGAVRRVGGRLVGFNTNGLISPGRCKMGGIGGDRPADVYVPGRIGVCSRSGGMSAEISFTLARAGYGVSTCVSLGGDPLIGMRVLEVLQLFDADPETDATVIYGEPGSAHEAEVAAAVRAGVLKKPIIALVVGAFQERYPKGASFGHVSAMIQDRDDSATAKRRLLAGVGVSVADTLDDLPQLLAAAGIARAA